MSPALLAICRGLSFKRALRSVAPIKKRRIFCCKGMRRALFMRFVPLYKSILSKLCIARFIDAAVSKAYKIAPAARTPVCKPICVKPKAFS